MVLVVAVVVMESTLETLVQILNSKMHCSCVEHPEANCMGFCRIFEFIYAQHYYFYFILVFFSFFRIQFSFDKLHESTWNVSWFFFHLFLECSQLKISTKIDLHSIYESQAVAFQKLREKIMRKKNASTWNIYLILFFSAFVSLLSVLFLWFEMKKKRSTFFWNSKLLRWFHEIQIEKSIFLNF